MSPLFLDYIQAQPRVQAFYPNNYTLNSIAAFARRHGALPLPHRESLSRSLAEQQRNWGGDPQAIRKFAAGAVAVVTGQQPGLFTGPLYSILKAITAIKLARFLDDSGIPAVPIFWIAAEDHDFEEIQWASVLDRDSAVRKITVDLENADATPVGWLRLKDDVRSADAECLALLPQSEFRAELQDLLDSTYRSDSSPVDAFGRMMTRLFGGAGLILADPLNPEMKRIAAPLLQQVVRQNPEIRAAIAVRNRALLEAGYHEQVRVDENFTGLFALRGRSRQPLKPSDLDENLGLSPNVLVRPVVQDTIFPNVAYVAGPAEIAYLAQASPVYALLGKELGPVFPRISATILESRVLRALQKYGMTVKDGFETKEMLKRKAVDTIQGVSSFEVVKEELANRMESLRPLLAAVDPTLVGALDTSKQKVLYQIETLHTRFINAETKRNEVMERQLESIANSLYPDRKLQERVINVTSFLARYGSAFIQRLQDTASLETTEHQVISI
jgi:uncharacterized protein YllA (UPF0747 family)